MYVIEHKAINPYTRTVYTPCGSTHTIIIRDLKTLRGVKNRLKSILNPPKNTIETHISITRNIYNEERKTLLECIVY